MGHGLALVFAFRSRHGHPYPAALVGSPGIGKSYFLFYLMFTLATTVPQPVVVLHIRGLQRVLCFTGSTVLTGTLRDFYHQLDDPKTW